MNILISMETYPFEAAKIAEGNFQIPACKLNEELTNPAVKVIFDGQRRVVGIDGQSEVVPYPSEWLAFGKSGDTGVLFREGSEQSPTEDFAAFCVKRSVRDNVSVNEKLAPVQNLKELKAVVVKEGFPPDHILPTDEELRACLEKRIARDRKLIDLGNALFSEHRGNAKFIPTACFRALINLGIHRPWERFSDTEAIDAQAKYLAAQERANAPVAAVAGRR